MKNANLFKTCLKAGVGVALIAMTASVSLAQQADFDSLGSNEGVLKRARAMSTKQQVRIVQKRAVDRDMRFEIGASYGGVAGGNSYFTTQPTTGMLEFHFTPRISVGARYTSYANQLTNEGKSQYEAYRAARAAGRLDQSIPEVDYPTSSYMGTISYYPMYGKINFFDISVIQFDLYAIGGLGQMQLKSGDSMTWTAGGGLGVWWTNHISSRFEVRHQSYSDKVQGASRDIGMIVGTFGLGILL